VPLLTADITVTAAMARAALDLAATEAMPMCTRIGSVA
jgi:hypothetical protein